MTATDISVIILIGQEKIHLKRCIERLAPLEPKCIWLIESQPDDGGVAIAKDWRLLPERSSPRMLSRGRLSAAIRRNSLRSASCCRE